MMNKHTSSTPVVSVVMPAYNAARFVEKAIRSVMEQTFSDWELLVLDDGSNDSTPDIIKELASEDSRIRFLPNEYNMGVAKTRNRGFDLCRGDYVALLDSDDVWHPQKLEKQLALARRTGAELLYTSYGIIDSQGTSVKKDYLVPEHITFQQLLKENMIGCSTVMLSRRVLQNNRFCEDFYHEDYVLWLQLLRNGCAAAGCTEVLTSWRYLENSRSFDKRKSAKNRWQIYRQYLNFPFVKSAWYFLSYALHGVKKYMNTR